MTKSRPSLLVVDDAAYNIDLLLEVLGEDYTVRVATDGAAALVSVKKHQPDLILLDVMMPGMDGFEVCRRLKEDPATQSIPIVFLTARNEYADEAYGFAIGAVDYITKPFQTTLVQARVRLHLELKQHRDHLEELVNQRTAALRLLTGRLAEAEENQLKMISRELHDQIGQNLNTIGLNLTLLKSLLGETIPAAVTFRIDDSLSLVKDTSARIRYLMADIRSPVLDDYGLLAALRNYSEQCSQRSGLSVSVCGQEIVPRPLAPVESALYRIVQEALTNVIKHAQATEVMIALKRTKEAVMIILEDNGRGYDDRDDVMEGRRKGWGLVTMQERAFAVGGNCRIESSPGTGTCVTVEVPL